VGSGTTVRIILPPAQGAPQAAEAKPLSPHDVGVRDERRLRVLLIDDETALGTSLRSLHQPLLECQFRQRRGRP